MSDALPLPPRPSLDHYKKRAKDLVKLLKAGDRDALRTWLTDWFDGLVELHRLDLSLPRDRSADQRRLDVAHAADRMLKHLEPLIQPSSTLAQVQFAIARAHGFASWPTFAGHIEGLSQTQSDVSEFEQAVDAIVGGDLETLDAILRKSPALAKARSTREHRSTLLHYVSANGVEDFRQLTPKNIVEITRRLLDAGADVDAESDAYGGRSTTLGLTATSVHPEAAGVQIPLMQLLIDRGARLDGPEGTSSVNACLHNGRGIAAEFLAARGARLDLEGAAGVGRLDVVERCFNPDGSLLPPSTRQQLMDALAWACQFGRTEVVRGLLQADLKQNRAFLEGGHLGLHWAACGGHPEIVAMLLEQHASPLNTRDDHHHATPLEWALYGWANSSDRADSDRFYRVVAALTRAGATADPQWFEAVDNRRSLAARIQADPRMLAALRGMT
jgi:ankyrin repeat protein